MADLGKAAFDQINAITQPLPQPGKNLFNLSTRTTGTVLNVNGIPASTAGYDTSDFIPVALGQRISISICRKFAFYNADKLYHSLIDVPIAAAQEAASPVNGYVRVTFPVANVPTARVEVLQSLNDPAIRVSPLSMAGLVAPVFGKNLFNFNTRSVGYFVSEITGNLSPGAYDTSDFIPISIGQNIAITICRKIVFYKADKSFHSGIDVSSITSQVVTTPTDGFMRVSFRQSDISNAQVELGTSQTSYEGYNQVAGYSLSKQVKVLADSIIDFAADVVVTKKGELFNIASKFDGSNTITVETSRSGSNNGSFNFLRTRIGATIVHENGDDITPIRTFNTVAANHGYTSVVKITMVGHGKSQADLGSRWTDGTTAYTLLIVSGNDLTFGCPYTVDVNGIVSASTTVPTQNLTHVSGATNTGVVSIVTVTTGIPAQLLPTINNKSVKYVLDGKDITNDGTYTGKELKVFESYNVMDYKEIIDYAQSHIGTSYANDSVPGAVRLSIIYTFTKGCKCHITHNFKALKKLTISDCGFMQSMPMTLTGYTLKRYLPHVKVKGGVDFQNIVDMTAYNTSLLFGSSDYVDPTKPPNRFVDWLRDGSGNGKVGFTMGYIVDKTNSKNADRVANTTNGWDMRDTKKSYPIAMSGLTLSPGDYKTFMGYRCYLSPANVGSATNINVVKDGKDTYVYIDYHVAASGISVQLSDDIGKAVTIIDSSNFTLLNDTVDSDGVTFNIIGTYGYAVLKIN